MERRRQQEMEAAAEAVAAENEAMETRRRKRKLSVDMDTDLAADHFRQLQAHRQKLQNDIGVLEHFLHVGRRRK